MLRSCYQSFLIALVIALMVLVHEADYQQQTEPVEPKLITNRGAQQ